MATPITQVQEFNCCECGRHIVVLCGPVSDPPMCAACIAVPGWFRNPGMARVIDPDHHRRPPEESR